MLAFALNPQPDKTFIPEVCYQANSTRPQRVKATTNLTIHERFVMKAEAIFPGADIVSHQSQET